MMAKCYKCERAEMNRLSSTATFTEFASAIIASANELLSGNDALQAALSVRAVGLWTPDVSVGWNVDAEPSLEFFTVNGEQRRYVFYKAYQGTSIQFRYRTCTIYGACSWSSPVSFDNSTTAVATTVFNNYLWFCFPYPSDNQVDCDRISSLRVAYYGPNPTGSTPTDRAPSIVRYDNTLYLFFKQSGSGAQPLKWSSYTTSWSSPTASGFTTDDGPGAVSGYEDGWGGTQPYLFVFYRRPADSRIAYRRFYPATSTWSSEYLVGQADQAPTSAGRIAAEFFRGRVHVAGVDASNDIWYASCALPCESASSWTRWGKAGSRCDRRLGPRFQWGKRWTLVPLAPASWIGLAELALQVEPVS